MFNGGDEKTPSLITLKNWWGVTLETLELDPHSNRVQRIDFFGANGRPVYHAILEGHRSLDGFEMPNRMVFARADNTQGFELAVDRLWLNVPVSNGMFMLEQPEHTNAN